MKKEKSETDNVYVCYCILREMHPGKHQAERLREITEALWDAQTFYEKMGALMFGQAFVYGSREVVVRPFTVYEEGFRETPEEFATTYSISGTLLRCYDLLNDFMPGEEEQMEAAGESRDIRLFAQSVDMYNLETSFYQKEEFHPDEILRGWEEDYRKFYEE